MALPSISNRLPSINLDSLTKSLDSLSKGLGGAGGAQALKTGGTGFSTQDTFQPAQAAQAAAAGGHNHTHGAEAAGAAQGPAKAGATGAAGAAGAAGGDLGAQLEALVKALSDIVAQLQALLQQMGGQGAAGGGGGGGGGEAAQAASGGGGGGHAHGAGEAAAAGQPANVSSDPALDQALQKLGQDPEGAKLLQAAQAAGLQNIQVADLPQGTMGLFQPGSKQILIDRDVLKNPSDLVRTLAHELGHAATVNNGNSQNEEALTDAIANRIADRVAPGGNRFQLDVGSYRNLQKDNGAADAFRQLGIAV